MGKGRGKKHPPQLTSMGVGGGLAQVCVAWGLPSSLSPMSLLSKMWGQAALLPLLATTVRKLGWG